MIRINQTYKEGIKGIPKILSLFIVIFLSQSVFAQDVLWFSNTPPSTEKDIVKVGMHRFSGKKGKRGSSSIIQWIREGDSHTQAKYIHLTDTNSFDFYIYSPNRELGVGKFINRESAFLSYASKEEGYYNAYLVQRTISSDTLYVSIAKADMLNHSCRNGHSNEQKKIAPHIYPETIPAEIVRIRDTRENYHYFATSSDEMQYQFIINGKPSVGSKLTFISQMDWKKTQKTNQDGVSTFQLIQDYFSPWKELNTRKTFYYLVYGEATINEEGVFQNQNYSHIHYTTSLSDGYRPAKTMYSSMYWAFIIFILTVFVSVVGIFVYRIRRNKTYKEVRFDEKD